MCGIWGAGRYVSCLLPKHLTHRTQGEDAAWKEMGEQGPQAVRDETVVGSELRKDTTSQSSGGGQTSPQTVLEHLASTWEALRRAT